MNNEKFEGFLRNVRDGDKRKTQLNTMNELQDDSQMSNHFTFIVN